MPVSDGWKNLIPAKKGEKRNPKGRPPVPAEVRKLRIKAYDEFLYYVDEFSNLSPVELESISEEESAKFTFKQLSALRLVKNVMYGDKDYVNIYLDRMGGKPRQELELSGNQDSPLKVIFENKLKTDA